MEKFQVWGGRWFEKDPFSHDVVLYNREASGSALKDSLLRYLVTIMDKKWWIPWGVRDCNTIPTSSLEKYSATARSDPTSNRAVKIWNPKLVHSSTIQT